VLGWRTASLFLGRRGSSPNRSFEVDQCILDIHDQIGEPIMIPTANAAIR
jgi:hypothetical protein